MLLALTSVLAGASCSKSDNGGWDPFVSRASLNSQIIGADETYAQGTTSGNPEHTFTITTNQEWCTPLYQTGSSKHYVGESFKLVTGKNAATSSRSAKATVRFSNGAQFELEFTQQAAGGSSYDRLWGEQPEKKEGTNLVYKTYYTTLSNGKRVRNYSVCYDLDNIGSRWVAYPVHSIYTSGKSYPVGGSTQGRTNAWAFDDAVTKYNSSYEYDITSTYRSDLDAYDTYTLPIIPQKKQQDIVTGAYGTGDNRGHMLPSASRYNTWQTNAQTFYATNMMPQNGKFNSGAWGTLENMVRSNSCADTLYVVVGTLYENATTIASKGRIIKRPTHCYKLLLRSVKGNTGKMINEFSSASELKSIAFLYENSASSQNTTLSAAAMTVQQIEQRTGMKFFRNLPAEIADQVKSQKNLSAWNQ